MSYKKILIAIDTSAYAMEAAKRGFELAHQLKASIGLVNVIDKNEEGANADLGITPDNSQPILIKQAEENIDQIIKLYDGIDEVVRFTPEGFPQEEIVNIASEWEADMIVIGTHGRKGLAHLLVGSVAEYVIKHINIPVMVVPHKTT
ncbi:universal stress protein [Elizabethkingia meningoseptica]|uniref:universal stress protein n=1 Tax=Elizabethkingia meningoseptica TaxID=238 RepID=UPI0023AE9844|nr:universal stress protein [Elizabethkingia meningoseptica]MDE5492752.1 universal stress protein [Elizabethkingia meningoseptica]